MKSLIKALRISLCLTILWLANAQSLSAQSLWLSLRQPITRTVLVVDSIIGADTIAHEELQIVPNAYRPFFEPDSDATKPINTVGFMVNYKPTEKKINFRSQYTAEARRDSFLASTGKTAVALDLDDPNDLSPIDRARLNYIRNHPEAVHYSWDEIPDPGKDVREGRRLHNPDADNKSISKLFRSDEPIFYKGLQSRPKEEASPWTFTGEENLQFTQLLYVNWIKGGTNSVTLLHDLRMSMNYAKDRHSWENSFTNKLGLTYTSDVPFRVSSDEFNLSSKYGFNAVNKWYYSFQTTFKTQLFRNYSGARTDTTLTSTLLSPAYIQLTAGMDYKKDDLSLLLSPYTCIITVVADTVDIDQTTYGVETGRKSDVVNGFSVTFKWKKTIMYGIYYTTTLELFYEYFKKDGDKRFDWENIFDVQINRYLSTRLLIDLRYYTNESTKFQLKENFSISFKYSF